MSTIKIKGHIYYETDRHKEQDWSFHMLDMRQWAPEHRSGRLWVQEHSFDVDVPDGFDPRPDQIALLRAEQQKVRAEFARRIKQIDDEINSLLAIENCVEEAQEIDA